LETLVVTAPEYEALVERIADAGDQATVVELLRSNPLTDEWQLRDALSLCDTPAEAHAVLSCNHALAQRVAIQTRAYERLNARDPVVDSLSAAVRAAANPVEAAALLAEATPEVYAHVAAQLALAQYDAEEIGRRYRELILGEKAQ
jgi:hypothetical protein